MPDELASVDAVGQAALVRDGRATPLELVDAAIARIEAVDPELRSVVLPRFEEARRSAGGALPDGPFRGVPVLVKDLGATSAGEPYTDGTRFLQRAGARAAVTDTVAGRIDDAGFVRLGRTSSPEIGLLPTTEPLAWGPTRNPWDLGRSTGGSSGGSAAAVAAGLVPVAHGSDGGGSIRIPASCCGLVGLKPSRGRIPAGPARNELTGPLSVHFFLTRSVRDTAALLSTLAGPAPGDPVVAPSATAPARPLRVALMTTAPGGQVPVADGCVAAAERAAAALEAAGHAVERAHPPALDTEDLAPAFGVVWSVTTAARVAGYERLVGRAAGPDDLEPLTWMRVEAGRRATALDWVAALDTFTATARAVAQWWDRGWDLLLTPTVATDPPPVGAFDAAPDEPLRAYELARRFVPFTAVWNATGQPAVSLPVHRSEAGLPAGAQLVAAYGREDLLLAAAAQLEEAIGWGDDRPPVHAAAVAGPA